MYTSTISIIYATMLAIVNIAVCELTESYELPPPRHNLTTNDMIFFGKEGRIKIISRAEYQTYMEGLPLGSAAQRQKSGTETINERPTRTLKKRCPEHTVWTLKPSEKYVGWDVPMSSVVIAPLNHSASLNVNEGFSMSNALSVSQSSAVGPVKKFMTSNFGINFANYWTTSYAAGYSFTIPAGKFGAIVINPLTTKHSGYMDVGCVGNFQRTEFSGESFETKKYSDMAWVEGLIGLCVGDTYPLKKCFGDGYLV